MDTGVVLHILIIILQVAQILAYALPKIISIIQGNLNATSTPPQDKLP